MQPRRSIFRPSAFAHPVPYGLREKIGHIINRANCVLADHASTASSYVINISNTITRFISVGTAWRVITYGM